jgi:hypothetical protein
MFQSAPRALARGDCGASKWQRRKGLVAHFRERGEFFRSSKDLDVKERLKVAVGRGG